jgi:hypothetical protein
MTRHNGPRGRFGPSECPPADNRRRSHPDGLGASAEDVLRQMAFVFHLARSVRAAMTGQEAWVAARPE